MTLLGRETGSWLEYQGGFSAERRAPTEVGSGTTGDEKTGRSEAVSVYYSKCADPAPKMEILVYALCAV